MQMSQVGTRDGCRVNRAAEWVAPPQSGWGSDESMTALLKRCPNRDRIVHVTGPLRTPVSRVMRHSVRALLRLGERRIVLDLSSISGVDAAGIGELVRAFNMSAAANGALRVVHATARVREMLERTQLFERLSGASPASSAAGGARAHHERTIPGAV